MDCSTSFKKINEYRTKTEPQNKQVVTKTIEIKPIKIIGDPKNDKKEFSTPEQFNIYLNTYPEEFSNKTTQKLNSRFKIDGFLISQLNGEVCLKKNYNKIKEERYEILEIRISSIENKLKNIIEQINGIIEYVNGE